MILSFVFLFSLLTHSNSIESPWRNNSIGPNSISCTKNVDCEKLGYSACEVDKCVLYVRTSTFGDFDPSEVAAAITSEKLTKIIMTLDQGLRKNINIKNPKIVVAGLNPHAGEDGYLGREELEVITPTLEKLRSQGLNLTGPLPADTLFTRPNLLEYDAVLAMYHDQGLPVLKYSGFGEAVNITLGLPFLRTSVDHGTALELAGSGEIKTGSLKAAVEVANLTDLNRT